MTTDQDGADGSIQPSVPGEFLSTITSHVTLEGDGQQKFYLLSRDSILVVVQYYFDGIRAYSDILGYIGIIITIALTLVTANFDDTFGIGKDTKKAFFIIALLFFTAMLIKSIIKYYMFGVSPEKLTDEIGKKGLKPTNAG